MGVIKRVALRVVLFLGGAVGVVLIYAAVQPPDYVISRDVLIQAPPERIFPWMNSNRAGEKWGPWLEVDPQAKMNYSGPDSGVGSKTSWDSRGQLGTGSATIVESIPNNKVGIALEYTKPMTMTQHSDYLLEPNGAQTRVTWRVRGQNTLLGRVMCLFINMDQRVGGMFEKGLSNLKRLVESQK